MLKECIDKVYPCGALKVEEERSLSKLEAIAAKLKRGKKLQNLQLQMRSSKDE